MFPARGALVPSLVPKQELVAANAAMLTGFQIMNIAGKAAGGFLILAIGPIAAMGLCGATYVVSSILISRMAATPACGAACERPDQYSPARVSLSTYWIQRNSSHDIR